MEIKEAKLDKDFIAEVRDKSEKVNKLLMIIGQEITNKHDLEKKIEEIDLKLKQYKNLHRKNSYELQKKLNELDEDYPNGEVDLEKGVIYYK